MSRPAGQVRGEARNGVILKVKKLCSTDMVCEPPKGGVKKRIPSLKWRYRMRSQVMRIEAPYSGGEGYAMIMIRIRCEMIWFKVIQLVGIGVMEETDKRIDSQFGFREYVCKKTL